jgi:hypothetical protein
MNTYLVPGLLSRTLRGHRISVNPRQAAADKDWTMLRLFGWTATTAILALLIWQTAAADPFWPPAVSALLLVIIGVLAGLRLGADSAAAYTKDLQRLNKVLADQNRELEDANAMLLRQVSDSTASPKSSCA